MSATTTALTRLIALGEPEANEIDAIAFLDQTLDPNWIIFHSRKPLRGRLDIDILIITPHGAFAAELKYYRDLMVVSTAPQWQRHLEDGRTEAMPNMLQGQAQKQAQRLKAELKNTAGLHQLWIEPVVIFTHDSSRLEFAASDRAQLEQVVFPLKQAKARLEALVAQNRRSRRPVPWEDVEKIAAALGQAEKLPAVNWMMPPPAAALKSDDRTERRRRRRLNQIKAILTLVGALLVTIAIYLVVMQRGGN